MKGHPQETARRDERPLLGHREAGSEGNKINPARHS